MGCRVAWRWRSSVANVQWGSWLGAEGLGKGVCAPRPVSVPHPGLVQIRAAVREAGGRQGREGAVGTAQVPCTGAVGRPLPCLIASQNEAFKDIAFVVEVEERLTGSKHLLKSPVTSGSVATLFLPLEDLPFQDVALAREQAHSQLFIPHCLPWEHEGTLAELSRHRQRPEGKQTC